MERRGCSTAASSTSKTRQPASATSWPPPVIHCFRQRAIETDGDADLLSLFYSDAPLVHTDVAFVSGSSTRLGGAQTLPIQDAIAARPGGLPFALIIERQNYTVEQDRVVFSASNAGDLNGDGADDLLTTSMYLASSDETGSRFDSPQIHIHYGIPGGASEASTVR